MTAYEADQAKNIDVINRVLRNEVSDMHGNITGINNTTLGRMARLNKRSTCRCRTAQSMSAAMPQGELAGTRSASQIQKRGI